MSNTHLKLCNALLLHLGIILTLEGDIGMVKTHLLGSAIAQGITASAPVHMLEQHASFAGWNLGLGVAMILAGFGMHAWITKREGAPAKRRMSGVRRRPSNA